ncbi:MAG: hypothetical protein HKN12_00510 [Gemmatimonadetes bacterium]|nr:hypothetical protein [Gemmatimonadota bacterium]
MHRSIWFAALVVVTVACLATDSAAQKLNPQISVIGDTRLSYSDATEEASLELEGVEFAFLGPLNPYASAEVFIGVHEGDTFEIEEAKLLLERYLPAGLGLTVGRTLLDFGQLNPLHPHAYPFLDRPLMHSELFGEDGAVDTAVRLDWIAPTDGVTLRATAGAVRGGVLSGGHGHDHEDEESPEIGFTGRVDLFAEPSGGTSFLIGGSVLHGETDPESGASGTFFGVDGKATFDLGPSRSLVLNAEAVFASLDATDEAGAADPSGVFASVDLRLNPRWNIGGFGESTTEREDDSVRTSRFGGFLGLALMEESTAFRVVGRTTDPDGGARETEVIVQALFGLGPHQPHRY